MLQENILIIIEESIVEIGKLNDSDLPPTKRIRGQQKNYKVTRFKIVQNVLLTLKERFAHIEKFLNLELFDKKKFGVFIYTCHMQYINAF